MNNLPLKSVTQHLPHQRLLGATFIAGILMTGCAPTVPTPENFPDAISDPFEPVNRGISKVNEKILLGVIKPTTGVYRKIAPPPVRKSVRNFSRNITYPGRLVNNVAQGRWKGAGHESLRFVTNSTVGVAGLFDPATGWNIPKSDADTAQTFNKWGWNPNKYIMLPLLGPSDDLQLAGRIGDRALEPWSYLGSVSSVSAGITFNELADQAEPIAQFIEIENDPYVGLKYLWTYTSKEHEPNWAMTGPKDPASLRTLGVAALRTDDAEFANKSRKGSVRIPSTGRKMKYNYWFQKEHSPLVYIAPGVGAHRLTTNILTVAENLYQNGYSVVTTTSSFHPEFMENASTVAVPAYPKADCHDVLVYLTEIDKAIEKKHPKRFGKRGFVGVSLGGFQALYIAANEKRMDPNLLRFDRYLAINPPVNLSYSNKQLDNYFLAPLKWPKENRQQRINNSLHKAAFFPFLPEEQRINPPIEGIESQYIIGLAFRTVLRDSIFSSQYRNNMGVIKTPLKKSRREAAYSEILQYSFEDYFHKFVVPYYKKQGVSRPELERDINLRSFTNTLRSDKKVRVITNKDDFILGSKNVSWLNSTLDSSRLTLFPLGGHVGNVATPAVEKATLKALQGLKESKGFK